MESIMNLFDVLSGTEVKILVDITEYMSGETVSGFSHTRIITNNIIVKFLSETPMIFTHGTLFYGHVSKTKTTFLLNLLGLVTVPTCIDCFR